MKREEIIKQLRSFVSAELLKGDDKGLDESTPLLELGLIDSISLVMIQNLVAEKWSVQLAQTELVPDNFQNLGTIADLVTRRLRG